MLCWWKFFFWVEPAQEFCLKGTDGWLCRVCTLQLLQRDIPKIIMQSQENLRYIKSYLLKHFKVTKVLYVREGFTKK